MKISIQNMRWFNKQYGCSNNKEINKPVEELVKIIGAQLGEIEEVINLDEKYDKILVARVVSCVKHPNADRLHICKIDDGGVAKGVKRDQHGYVQVVCGAPNVKSGMTVAWLPPGAVVPSTWDKEKFVLEARELRGETSNGMLASPAELALSDNHDGILEIRSEEVGLKLVKPGTPFKSLYGLDDTVIDIENKMFTHRPDCFGMLGVARELAGVQDQPFRSPDWYIKPKALTAASAKPLQVSVEIPKLVPRYQAVVLSGIKVGPSPIWLQSYLTRLGAKPINNIVDMTNYLMLTTGQPLHAFDYDKVAKGQIVVRHPQPKEKLSLLDGKTITPRAEAILICDADKPIALGGVMGGNNSQIDADTTNIVIESANFDMYNIRRTSMAHGLFTDAVTRFTKGQSPWQTESVLAKAVAMTQELCPAATVASAPVDVRGHLPKNSTVKVGASFINERLGLQLTALQMTRRLENVEFGVARHGDQLEVTAPFWRTDIEVPEDVVEEIGRLYGYDHLPLQLPQRDLTPANPDPTLSFKKRLRDLLSAAGANEALTYSFVHGDLLKKVGQDPKLAFKLSNALSPDLQYYRMSLMPSLLDKVHANIKAGNDQFALFELGKCHNKLHADDDTAAGRSGHGLPTEYQMLALLFTASDKAAKQYAGAPFFQARAYLDYLAAELGLPLTYTPFTKVANYPVMKPYDQSRSALVGVAGTKVILGSVGEFRPEVLAALKLPSFTAGFEIGPAELQEALDLTGGHHYQSLARYPRTSQDISLKLPATVNYATLYDLAETTLLRATAAHGYQSSLEPLDIYQATDGHDRHVTLRVTLWHAERTLQSGEASKVLDALADAARSKLQAERL